jgi:hypothetical protein
VCQPSLWPWVVSWRDAGRAGWAAWLTEAEAETYATAILATCGAGVVVTVCRDGVRWAEYRWNVKRIARRASRAVSDTKAKGV